MLPQEALAELCRQDSRALDLLHPFLTDEQVKALLGQVTNDTDEQA